MGENRQARRLHEPGIESDIDAAHEGGDIGFALRQPVQDRGLAILAVANVVLHEAVCLTYGAAVAGQANLDIDAPNLLPGGTEMVQVSLPARAAVGTVVGASEAMYSLIAPSGGATTGVDHAMT